MSADPVSCVYIGIVAIHQGTFRRFPDEIQESPVIYRKRHGIHSDILSAVDRAGSLAGALLQPGQVGK